MSHRHRNSWKAHILPQKVYKSANWNESSVEWTLVDLDFAFVNDFQFWGCPTATKMTYFELHNKRLLLVYSWKFQVSLWKTFGLSEKNICTNFLLIYWFRSASSIHFISVAVGQPLKPLILYGFQETYVCCMMGNHYLKKTKYVLWIFNDSLALECIFSNISFWWLWDNKIIIMLVNKIL